VSAPDLDARDAVRLARTRADDGKRMQRPLLLVPALALVAGLVASCGSGEGPESDDRASAIYAAVIRSVVTEGTNAAEVDVPVFVAPTDPKAPISLEVQAGVVEELHDFATVRFVDDAMEAIDEDEVGQPVVDDGVLVKLGTVPTAGDSVVVEAERYESANSHDKVSVRVARSGESWTAKLDATTVRDE
jgi:hypothetical protein